MKFGQLYPGDVMTLAGQRAVVLAIERPHPLDFRYILVVWYIFGDGFLSFDMLSPHYELIPGSSVTRDGLVSFRQALDEIHAKSSI